MTRFFCPFCSIPPPPRSTFHKQHNFATHTLTHTHTTTHQHTHPSPPIISLLHEPYFLIFSPYPSICSTLFYMQLVPLYPPHSQHNSLQPYKLTPPNLSHLKIFFNPPSLHFTLIMTTTAHTPHTHKNNNYPFTYQTSFHFDASPHTIKISFSTPNPLFFNDISLKFTSFRPPHIFLSPLYLSQHQFTKPVTKRPF